MKTRLRNMLWGAIASLPLFVATPVAAQEYNNGSCCCDDASFSVWADLLVLELCKENAYATSNDTSGTPASRRTVHNHTHDWDFGFRLGAAYYFDCDDWALEAQWTWYQTDAKTSMTPAAGSTLTTRFYHDETVGMSAVTELELKSDIDYNVLDILVSKRCCICENLQVKAFGGFRGFWYEDQTKFNLRNAGTFTTAGDGFRISDEVNAYGLHAGFDWYLCVWEPLRIHGKIAGSGLVGTQDFHYATRAAGADVRTHKADFDCQGFFNFETALGLAYDWCWCDWVITFHADYETIYWNNIEDFFGYRDYVYLHGFSFGAQVYF